MAVVARAFDENAEYSFPLPSRSRTGSVPSERLESPGQASTAGRGQQEEERGVRPNSVRCELQQIS